MPTRRNRTTRAAKQAIELAFAVPQVVAHRTVRMAKAGTTPSLRDQREFWLMGSEKVLAFYQSWWAMLTEAGRINQQIMLSLWQAPWSGWMKPMPGLQSSATRLRNAMLDIAAKGAAPIHRRATANARRLSRSRR
jgi:hypothetical protein